MLGNLAYEEYGKNKQQTRAGEYTFDETNKMVGGVNANGEQSIYTCNGLGALMENTWVIAKNGVLQNETNNSKDMGTITTLVLKLMSGGMHYTTLRHSICGETLMMTTSSFTPLKSDNGVHI